MLVKPRAVPRTMFILESILTRLPDYYPNREELAKQLKNVKAGYNGESEIDFPLSYLDFPDLRILHDLRLHDGQHYFQIDTLLVLPNVLIILEVKNISGTLKFKTDFKQVIRSLNDEEEAFTDFHLQVDRQKRCLEKWLKKRHLPIIPIDYFIVMANTRTIVTSAPTTSHILEKVIPCAQIPSAVAASILRFNRQIWKKSIQKKAADLLISQHEESRTDLLQKYKLAFFDLKKGVACPSCLSLPMKRMNGKWICLHCQFVSVNAHHLAIKELLHLVNEGASNRMVRDFLCLESPVITNRILKSMNLVAKGTNKGRRYFWNQAAVLETDKC